VTVAAWLQLATVLVVLSEVVLNVAYAVHFDGAIDRAARLTDAAPSEVSDERVGNLVGTLVTTVPGLLLAIWLAVCVLPVLRGRNAARILSVIPAGLMLVGCAGLGILGSLFGLLLLSGPVLMDPSVSGPSTDPGFPVDPQFVESDFIHLLYSDTDPVWDTVMVVTPLVSLLVTALTVAVAVLLLLPPANRFFGSRRQVPAPWPVPGYGYPVPAFGPPGYPYPPYAGYWPASSAPSGWSGPVASGAPDADPPA
jgi:hypothetical protein